VPENALKLVVGVLLSSFGTFWSGEALGVAWPGEDLALLLLAIGYAAVAALGIAVSASSRRTGGDPRMKLVVAVVRELFGLFVEDGAFAVAIRAWLGLFAGDRALYRRPVARPAAVRRICCYPDVRNQARLTLSRVK